MAATISGALTSQQQSAIRADVAANGDLNTIFLNANPATGPVGEDRFPALAALYNVAASPAFTVWRTAIPSSEIRAVIDATELDGLSILKLSQLTFMIAEPVDASLLNRRAFFAKVFSGANGTITLPALTALAKRLTSRIEKLLATGTGSDAVPGILGFEGFINSRDLAAALAN